MLNPDKQPEWQTSLGGQRKQAEECSIGCWLRDPNEKSLTYKVNVTAPTKTRVQTNLGEF